MTMFQRTLGVSLAAIAALCAFPAWAEIISVSSTGPGGSTPTLEIDTVFKPMDFVNYRAIYTANASIVLTLTVSGGGAYHVGGSISNQTGNAFNSFSFILLDAPSGSEIYAASFDRGNVLSVFRGSPVFEPDEATFNGPTGLAVGFSTLLNVDFTLPRSDGMDTFEVVLTPLAPSVVTSRPEPPPISILLGSGPEPAPAPEASTWAMMLIGFAGLCGAALRRNGRAVV